MEVKMNIRQQQMNKTRISPASLAG